MKKLFIILVCLTAVSYAENNSDITVQELKEHIQYLASDSLKGRKAGTPEGKLAADYIRKTIENNDIDFLVDDGFQTLSVVTHLEMGNQNGFQVGPIAGEVTKDFIPSAISDNGALNADVVFAGYGFDIKTDNLVWNDYDSVMVKDKWVMLLLGDPEPDSLTSAFAAYSDIRKKCMVAKDQGAGGVIFTAGKEYDKNDELPDLAIRDSHISAGLPVVYVKRAFADSFLKTITIDSLEKKINTHRKSASFETGLLANISTEVMRIKSPTQNVVAVLQGSDPVLKNKYIIIGAHYDHLGFGGPGSGSRRPDTSAVHNGADDNASGVSAIMEIFEKLDAHRESLKQSVIFVAFAAEEMGVLGSNYFVQHPPVDLKNVTCMINLDMVGRLKEALSVSGTGTAAGLQEIVEGMGKKHNLKLALSPEGYGPSDHSSFYAADIPVLMFFTGAHEDYHTPFDDADKIDFDGMKKVSDLVYDIVLQLANRSETLVFQEAGPKYQKTSRRRFKVTLGIMPDHAAEGIKGLRVEAVFPNRPGFLGGLQKGDIIVAMDGKSVGNIYDYMHRLSDFSAGQRITVEVMRNGEKHYLIVEL